MACRKVASKDYTPNKRRGKERKGPHSGSKPMKKIMAMRGNQTTGLPTVDDSTSAGWSSTRTHTAWMASVPLNLANHLTHVVMDLDCTQSIGSRTAIRKVPETCVVILWHYRSFAVAISPLCLQTV